MSPDRSGRGFHELAHRAVMAKLKQSFLPGQLPPSAIQVVAPVRRKFPEQLIAARAIALLATGHEIGRLICPAPRDRQDVIEAGPDVRDRQPHDKRLQAVVATQTVPEIDCKARAGQNPLMPLPSLLTRVERARAPSGQRCAHLAMQSLLSCGMPNRSAMTAGGGPPRKNLMTAAVTSFIF
jgi:hypothetical protein